jgi:L-threonylcarbamoyladenylate synthase
MQRIFVNAEHPDDAAVAPAVEVLRQGGVVAFPTDTLYGLAVDPRSDAAVAKLFALKGRGARVAVPLIGSSIEQVLLAGGHGTIGAVERRVADAFWPGPLSIVIRPSAALARGVLGGETTVAVRVPAHPVARQLAAAFGFCVTATSANPTGSAPAASADDVAAILPAVDLLLDGGDAPGGAPSTIVGFDSNGPVLLRAGAIAWERVLKSLQ